ncbi:hypothetical protein B0H13DRAFT_1666159, partial [Mycena leptocephala]
KALDGASLDGSGLDVDAVDRLRHPIQSCVDLSDNKDFRLSLDIFLTDTYASEATYTASRAAFQSHSPDVAMLSHCEIEKNIELLTGVVPFSHDMCINSFIGFFEFLNF